MQKDEYEFDPKKKPRLKGKSVKEYRHIIDVLYTELKRKDKLIDELKNENRILMNTAFRAQKKVKETEEMLKNSIEKEK
ncbi:hypothetical protein GF327_04540 [Candidatus Woesearchaeota archaeon]|nr:hypothetical protein [Candidatus Woesearchaeota archaeon]